MTNKTAYIYHNPRCSKSRATLKILQDKNIRYQIIEYLNSPPTVKDLEALLRKLGTNAESIVRKNEDTYPARFQQTPPSESEILVAIAADPILLERPIVVYGERAIIGRPPERIYEVL